MKILLLGIFVSLGINCSAQFPLEFFINKDQDKVIIFYADYISIPAENDSLPRPATKSSDVNPMVITVSPCKTTQSVFSCSSDSTHIKLAFHFTEDNYLCDKITIWSSEECANLIYDQFMEDSKRLKWITKSENVKIASVPFRKTTIDEVLYHYYLEATSDSGFLSVEEKFLSKQEWKMLRKELKKKE